MEEEPLSVPLLRAMLKDENEQMHRRLAWLGTFQGFLFAALGFSWGKNVTLTHTISLLGFFVALLIYFGMHATVRAIRRIQSLWDKHKPADYQGPGIAGFIPEGARFTFYLSCEMLIPLAFVGAWVWIGFFARTDQATINFGEINAAVHDPQINTPSSPRASRTPSP